MPYKYTWSGSVPLTGLVAKTLNTSETNHVMKNFLVRLLKLIKRSKSPKISIDDAQFGNLCWNHELFYWEGASQVAGVAVTLTIETPEDEIPYTGKKMSAAYQPDMTITENTRAMYRSLGPFIDNVAIEALVERNFELAKAWCMDAGNELLNKSEFCDRVSLIGIVLNSNGSGELLYHDGDMFGGHSLYLVFDENFKIIDSGIQG